MSTFEDFAATIAAYEYDRADAAAYAATVSPITESDSAFAAFYNEHLLTNVSYGSADGYKYVAHSHSFGTGPRTNVCECGYVLPL